MRQNPYAKDTDQWRAWQKGYLAAHNDWKEAAEAVHTVKTRSRWRSSIVGRWVSKAFAEENPDTTEHERG